MGAAQSSEDVPDPSSGTGKWHHHGKMKQPSIDMTEAKTREKCLEGLKKMTVPEIPTGTFEDLDKVHHRPPPSWIPPEPKSQELTKEQRALIESMIKTPYVQQCAQRPSAGPSTIRETPKISSNLENQLNILKVTTQELKDIVEEMEEPMRQLKNDGMWKVDLFPTCKDPATNVQAKLNTLLCASQKLQKFSDATSKETAKIYEDDVSKIKSLSDKLVLTLSENEAAKSVNCYKAIVECTGLLQKKLDELFDAPSSSNEEQKGPEQVKTKIDDTPYEYEQETLDSNEPAGNNSINLCDEPEGTNNENDEDSVELLETIDLDALMEKKTFYHSPKPSTSTDSKDFSFQNSGLHVFQQILSKFCEETIQIGKTYFKNLKFDNNNGSRAMTLRHFMKIESDILNFQMRTASIALNTDTEKDIDIEFSPIISFGLNKKTVKRHQDNMKEMLQKIQCELGVLEKRFKKKTTIKPLMDENLNLLAFYILSMYNSNQELKVAGETKEVLNKSYAFSTLTWMFRLLLSMETQETLPETSRTNFEECIDSTKNRFDTMNLD